MCAPYTLLRIRDPVSRYARILVAVRIGGAAILADRQRVYQRRLGLTLHRLEQRRQKRRQLVAGVVYALHLAQVDRQLVKQNQGRLATEKLAQRFGSGGDTAFVAVMDPLVAGPAGKRIGDLAPGGVRQNAVTHCAPVGGIRVLAVERGHPHRALRQQTGIDELADGAHILRTAHGVHQGDQGVGLTAPVGRVEPEDRRCLAACAAEPAAYVGEQVLQAARRPRAGEEAGWFGVLLAGVSANDLRQVGREVRVRDTPGEDVGPRAAGFEYGWNRHVCVPCGACGREAPSAVSRRANGGLAIHPSARDPTSGNMPRAHRSCHIAPDATWTACAYRASAQALHEPPVVPFEVARLVAALHPVALAVVLGRRLHRDHRAGRARPLAVGIGVVDVYGQPLRVGAADRQAETGSLLAPAGRSSVSLDQIGLSRSSRSCLRADFAHPRSISPVSMKCLPNSPSHSRMALSDDRPVTKSAALAQSEG